MWESVKQYVKENLSRMRREPGGILRYPYIVPGSDTYATTLWDWDSWWTCIAIGQADAEEGTAKNSLPYEQGCILNFLDHMDDYGISPGIQELVKRTRDRYPNIIGHIKELETSVEKVTMFFKTPQDKRDVREALKGVKDIIVSSSLPNNLEVNAAGATKGGGLLRLAEYLGISAAQTMAFGDGENDITMIESAGCGVVMENGAPFLKEKADYITLSNEEAGVAAAIKKLVLEDGTPISPMEG